MRVSGTDLKFLFALSVPPVLLVLAAIGAASSGIFTVAAHLLIITGGICLASAIRKSAAGYAMAAMYVVALEIPLLLLG
jgi:hypothetical protein